MNTQTNPKDEGDRLYSECLDLLAKIKRKRLSKKLLLTAKHFLMLTLAYKSKPSQPTIEEFSLMLPLEDCNDEVGEFGLLLPLEDLDDTMGDEVGEFGLMLPEDYDYGET